MIAFTSNCLYAHAGIALLLSALLTDPGTVLKIQSLITDGRLDEASRLIEAEVRQSPNEAGLLNLRGVVHAQKNELGQARADFELATQLAPSLTPAWQNLSRACQQLNEVDCSVRGWQRVLHLLPNDQEAHAALASGYEAQSKFAESLRELNSSKEPNLALKILDLAGLGRMVEAKAVAAQMVASQDFVADDLARMHGPLDLAKSADLVATIAEGLDARGIAGISTLQRLALSYERLGRNKEARKTLERVAKEDPQNTAHLLELARLAESDKDFEGALGYLAHARDLAPRNARIHFLFGLIAGELNLPIEAKHSLDKALALDPDNADYNYAMGSVILKTRDAASAAGYFEKFVKSRPGDPAGRYALGVADFASGNYDKSREQMLQIENDPSTAAAAEYYLARMARLEGSLDEAKRRLRKSIELMPRFSETHTELARIALMEGNLETAHSEIEQALRLAPEGFQANEQLLVLFNRTHDPRAAKQKDLLAHLDEERSKRAELMLRTIEVRP